MTPAAPATAAPAARPPRTAGRRRPAAPRRRAPGRRRRPPRRGCAAASSRHARAGCGCVAALARRRGALVFGARGRPGVPLGRRRPRSAPAPTPPSWCGSRTIQTNLRAGRRRRHQRLPRRRPRAGRPARGVRPRRSTAASQLIAEAAAGPAGRRRRRSAALNSDAGRLRQRRSSRPGPTTGRASRSGAQYLTRRQRRRCAPTRCPSLTNLVDANADRGRRASSTRAERPLLWLVLAGLLALVVLAGVAGLAGPAHPPLRQPRRWPARRVAVLVDAGRRRGRCWPASAAGSTQVARRRSTPPRWPPPRPGSPAYDAKANESLTLIARGSGRGLRDGLAGARTAVDGDLASGPTPATSTGTRPGGRPTPTVHTQIRDARRRRQLGRRPSRWRPAPGTGSAQRRLQRLRHGVARAARSDQRRGHRRELADAGGWLLVAGVLGLLAGLAGRRCVAGGASRQRLEEYR